MDINSAEEFLEAGFLSYDLISAIRQIKHGVNAFLIRGHRIGNVGCRVRGGHLSSRHRSSRRVNNAPGYRTTKFLRYRRRGEESQADYSGQTTKQNLLRSLASRFHDALPAQACVTRS